MNTYNGECRAVSRGGGYLVSVTPFLKKNYWTNIFGLHWDL